MARRDAYIIEQEEPNPVILNNCNVMIGTHNTFQYNEYYYTEASDSDGGIQNLEATSNETLSIREENGIQPVKVFPSSYNATTVTGRIQESAMIRKFLNHSSHRILQVFGPAFVGKKYLTKKNLYFLEDVRLSVEVYAGAVSYNLLRYYLMVLSDFSISNGRPIIIIPCKQLSSWTEFINAFAEISKLKVQVKDVTDLSFIASFKNMIDKHQPVLLFTNCERLSLTNVNYSKRFKDFLIELTENCSRTKIIVTSQQQIDFGFGNISMDIKLSEMSSSKSLSLLEELLPDEDTESYKDVILERCFGLPTFILDAASLIRDSRSSVPLTNDDLKNLLLDDVRLSRIQCDPCGTSNMEMAKMIPSVPPDLQQAVSDLSILINGQFGLNAVEAVLGKSASEVKYIVRVLCKHSVLKQDGNTPLFQFSPPIAGILRSIMKPQIFYNDTTRLRFVKFFGEILLKTNTDLYLPSQQSLYGYDGKSWTHLQKVLQEAIHCTNSTFDAFKQVALKADNIIINCFPRESVQFYEQLTDIAERFGSSNDVASLKAQLARALTVNKGTNLKYALTLFQEAEEVLKLDGPSSALICLMRDMAFNYFKDAKYKEAIRCCEEGIKFASKVENDDKDISRILSIRSLAAINYNNLGDSEKAKVFILETLELAKEFSTSDPSIYIMFNTLGIIYEKRKNNDEALRYYKASLHERRKYEKISPKELIVTLNNVGMQYCRREQHDQALKYLEEALSICKKCGIHYDKAGLTYMNLAMVNLKLTKYELASNQLQESIKIYSACSENQNVHINLRLSISHCHVIKGKLDMAKEILKECHKYTQSLIDQAPTYDHYLAALAHLVILTQDNKKLCEETLKKFVNESSRLLKLWCGSDARIEITTRLLSSATQILENIFNDQRIDVTPFVDIDKICFVCRKIISSDVDIKRYWKLAEAKTANSALFQGRLLQL